MTTTVVNQKTQAFDVYIGRKNAGMHYGNPASHLSYGLASIRVATREESIRAFEAWLAGSKYQDVEPERRLWILSHLKQLKGKRLGCFCKPLACHGDVLAQLADQA